MALFDQFPHPSTGPAPHHLVRLTADLGLDTVARTWRQVTGDPLPHAVRTYLQTKETDR